MQEDFQVCLKLALSSFVHHLAGGESGAVEELLLSLGSVGWLRSGRTPPIRF